MENGSSAHKRNAIRYIVKHHIFGKAVCSKVYVEALQLWLHCTDDPFLCESALRAIDNFPPMALATWGNSMWKRWSPSNVHTAATPRVAIHNKNVPFRIFEMAFSVSALTTLQYKSDTYTNKNERTNKREFKKNTHTGNKCRHKCFQSIQFPNDFQLKLWIQESEREEKISAITTNNNGKMSICIAFYIFYSVRRESVFTMIIEKWKSVENRFRQGLNIES